MKPAKPVKRGDELLIAFAGNVRAVRVEALGERRGPAREARGLYSDLEEVQLPLRGAIDMGAAHLK